MTNVVQIRRSSTATAIPTAGQILQGELALNLADGALFTKDNTNTVIQLNKNIDLNDTLTSTSTTEGATANAVKQIKDIIDGFGTVHEAANILGRDALATAGTVDYLDLVHVLDDGDGKWARYQNLGTSAAPNFVKIQDEDALAAGLVATDLGYTAAPTDGTVTNTSGNDATIPLADATNAGLISPAEKTKLGGLITPDLAHTASPTGGTVTNAGGTDATLPLADGTNAGYLAPADFTKLGTLVTPDLAHTASPTGGTVTNAGGTDATLPLVDATNSGYMSPADFIKLGTLAVSDLAHTASPTIGTITNANGTNATIPLADATNSGYLAPGDFSKLAALPANPIDTHLELTDTPAAFTADDIVFVNAGGTALEYRTNIDGGAF